MAGLGGLPTMANAGNMVNAAVDTPATERYPGAVSPVQYSEADTGEAYPIEGPATGDSSPFGNETTPPVESGGGIVDLTYMYGTDGPVAAWDSSGGQPTIPNLSYPGAVPPELHGEDGTGSVAANWTVVPAGLGRLVRQTITGQTYNREYADGNVPYNPSVNGRIDLDQRQAWDPHPNSGGGYNPWDPGYAERPVFLNVAYQQPQVNPVDNVYGVSAALPDKSQYQVYDAHTYAAPPDPIVTQPPVPAGSSSGGWLLG